MSKSKKNAHRVAPARRTQIESLEERVVMSADPLGGLMGSVHQHAIADGPGNLQQHDFTQEAPALGHHARPDADFWLDNNQSLEDQIGDLEQSLSSAHRQTGLDRVHENYGFDGTGQTVAVIDSGIAYDHYALGGGLGSGYRVVGGWDFTENDSDPYDDGAEGSHGTHVAGIVGADAGDRSGVATGVDLVGLRVFADDGSGYFSWVEDALRWVHANRNSFENPITTVNLSLGTNWNSSTTPAWAMLEDEFAQLKADGIFISVSAGNSFTSYNTPGLSYPAASPHVVPVMSTDDSGMLSYFSQRHQRAIAAPGRYIYSTVPDYAGNNNGITDDWANFSGTSMAAPYVAGASTLIREAMEFVGRTNITQDDIIDHMFETADEFVDSKTNLTYSRLNIGNAIEALMPEDDFGSSIIDAYNLGSITEGGLQTAAATGMSGVIGSLQDSDYFTFTAGVTGRVTFTAANTTHSLDASWEGFGGNGAVGEDGSYTMEVIAGQEYTVALSTAGGLGYYDLDISAESTFVYTDWGTLNGQQTQSGLTADGESWFRVAAGQAGFFTVDASYAVGSVSLDLYDLEMNLIDAGGVIDRVDHYASTGDSFFVRVAGDATGLDIRLTNLVSANGDTVMATGTEASDTFSLTAGAAEHTLVVNGVSYTFSAADYENFELNGAGGIDSITMTGTAGDETAALRVGSSSFGSADFTAEAENFEIVSVYSGGGADIVRSFDTAGDELYTTHTDRTELTGDGFRLASYGFAKTYAFASGGDDRVDSYDSAGDDLYRTWSDRVVMSGDGFYNFASGFDRTYGHASTGNDRVYSYDSAGDDLYRTWSDRVVMSGNGFYNYSSGFDFTYGYGSTGADNVYSYDSAGDDLYRAWEDRVILSGDGFSNYAGGFDRSYVYGSTGYDVSYSYDSAGDDTLRTWHNRTVLSGNTFYNYIQDFDRTYTYATTGDDRAFLYDSAGDDLYRAWHNRTVISGEGFYNYAQDFDRTNAYATTGNDVSQIYDTTGNDLYRTWSNRVVMSGSGFYNYAQGFGRTFAYSSGGFDTVQMYDSVDDDTLNALAWGVTMQGDSYRHEARGFDRYNINGGSGGNDVSTVEAIDYALTKADSWA